MISSYAPAVGGCDAPLVRLYLLFSLQELHILLSYLDFLRLDELRKRGNLCFIIYGRSFTQQIFSQLVFVRPWSFLAYLSFVTLLIFGIKAKIACDETSKRFRCKIRSNSEGLVNQECLLFEDLPLFFKLTLKLISTFDSRSNC